MNILVTGGTGFVGQHVCRELASRDHEVTALSRSPSSASLPETVSTRQGDVTEYESIENAFSGRDAVLNLVALSPLRKPRGGNRMHDVVHRGGTENVVRAAEFHDLDRIVQLSGIHADPGAPTAYLRAKGRAEQLVKDSECEWVIHRPTTFFGEGDEIVPFVRMVAPPYITPLPGGGNTLFQLLWIGDAAPMIADSIDRDKHANHVYELGGRDRYTLAEIARLLHAVNGRPTNVIPVPMPIAKIGFSLGGYIPGFPFTSDQYHSLKFDLITDRNDIEAFGVSPDELRSFRSYLGLERS